MANNVVVTQTVTPIYPAGVQSSITVYNSGTEIIYLGDSSSLQPANGFPVRPGSTVTWSAKQALYAVCDVTKSSTLVYDAGVDSVFDSAAVANQILTQGLAAQIANQIKLSGVPLIDMPSARTASNLTINTSTPARQLVTSNPLVPVTDCSKYQSMVITLYETRQAFASVPIPARSVVVRWYDSTGTIVMDTDVLSVMPILSTTTLLDHYPTRAVIPVKANLFDIVVYTNSDDAQASPQNNIYLQYVLSFRAQGKRIIMGAPLLSREVTPDLVYGGDFLNADGYCGATYNVNTIPASTSKHIYLPGIPGQSQLSLTVNSGIASGQTVSFFLYDSWNSATYAVQRFSGPTSILSEALLSFIMPQTPMVLEIAMPATSCAVAWALASSVVQ